jgi:hypothetical protein
MRWEFYPVAFHLPVDAAGRAKQARYVGRTTRMGVEQYQDYTFYINDDRDGRRGRQLTDEQLRADWQHEFPEAGPFSLHDVRGAKRDFKSGTRRSPDGHGSAHGVRGADGEVIGPGASDQP